MGNIKPLFNIGNHICQLRKEHGLTQAALANAVGVTRATINAMEKMNYNPSLELAFRLARFFETDIQAIFFIDGDQV